MSVRRVSSTDIARAAGVSQATVSYVLNRRPGKTISPETRDRVLSAARDMGYQANQAARALVTGKTGMIALWMPNAHHRIFAHVTEAVMRCAERDGMRVVIIPPSMPSAEERAMGTMTTPHVDGVFAHHGARPVDDYIDATLGRAPIVSTGASYTARCDSVGVDLFAGSLTAVRHLVSVGCRGVAYVSLSWAVRAEDHRYRAYLLVCAEAGMEPRVITIENVNRPEARAVIGAYLKDAPSVDGLFCWNDEIATGANMAARDAGRVVPDDLAIIGSDGTDEAEFQYPALSTVAMPIETMVDTAWRFLMRRIEEPDSPLQHVLLPMSLIERQSTQRPSPMIHEGA